MKKIKLYALCLMATVAMLGCSKYDDTELRGRVENLEEWQKSVNSDIVSLKSLIAALEAKDFVTGVTPLSDGTGYVITFVKSGAVTIKHGEKGATPIIGTMKDADGKYYWTVDGKPLTNDGAKVPVTGEKGADGEDGADGATGADGANGITPQLRINSNSGEWEVSTDGGTAWTSTGVKAQGDAIFAKGGIDYKTDPANVIFTLADGVTKIRLPKSSTVTVGFDSHEAFYCSETDNEMTIVLPATLKESDYNAISATISSGNGTDMDIQTRSASSNTWGVEVTKPTFTNGVLDAGSAKVKITLPQDKIDYKALLKVTLIDSKGKESSVSRVVWFKVDNSINVIDNTTGNLSDKITDAASIKELSIIGSMSGADFAFVRANLTSIELLDLSRLSITELPSQAMAFYDAPNKTLKTVILPDKLVTIGDYSFAKCENLQEMSMPKSVRILGERMFEGCLLLEEVKIPEGVSELPARAFLGSSIKRVNIPESVTTIGDAAFWECEKLESVNIPSGVTKISNGLFYKCVELKQVNWHDNITSIGDDAFSMSEKLFSGKDVVLPSKVTTIGMRAFSWAGMTSVKLPEGLETVGASAFHQCKMTTIDFPSTITSIHAIAFYWKTVTTVICRSATPPAMPLKDDNGNGFDMFDSIGRCVLKRPASSDYSIWNSYFGAGIKDL